jgi:hypothetical protein
MSVSDALEITKLLEMVSSFAGTPGQNQLVVSASAAATCGIGAMAKTSAASIAPSTFVSLFASLFGPRITPRTQPALLQPLRPVEPSYAMEFQI